MEYLPNAETLNCVNYSESLFDQAIAGMKKIHKAGVHHRDTWPRSMLLVRGNDGQPDRLVWVDFDVATTFDEFEPEQLADCGDEIEIVKGLGELLVRIGLRVVLSYLRGLER